MKKIYFGVYKFRKIFVNFCIVLLLGIITAVAFLGGNDLPVSNITNGVYYSGQKDGNKVSLMVNVYWGEEYIEDMLNVFSAKGVKTTFFLGGMWVLENEDLVMKILNDGHEIANHGYKHKSQDKISYDDAKFEIETTHNLIEKLTNQQMTLFAPPSGAYNEQTVEVAKSLGYKTIMWTRDTIDWRDHNTQLIYSRAIKDLSAGDLILMHPTDETLEALPKIIDFVLSQNLIVSTVSDCLSN